MGCKETLTVANSELRLNNIILKIPLNQSDEYSNNRNIKETFYI